ncbi:hypothetical protein Smp_081030 [Schistosoma mansoni]|uniref:hypothetical protein n=1 Tax=Schistosoma mansoni TaxID=6183 RepID=UPI00022DCB35|nr:hypothetical protein Smp_081030 [Schistosoma mansoni]|eukprot:XP_018654614.1 hypothetical protein Smp_081030 [Schistosoma mansoni]
MTGPRAQFLAEVKALQHEFNRSDTPSMFIIDVSEPYKTLKRSILKRSDLTDRQKLDQLLNNIDLRHGSLIDMLLRMREVISQKTFIGGLFKHFPNQNPSQVQSTDLVSNKRVNSCLYTLTAS